MSPNLQNRLIDVVMAGHPLPYTIDQDWTWKVLDATGRVVLMCQTHAEAAELVALCEERARVNAEAQRQVDELMKEDG